MVEQPPENDNNLCYIYTSDYTKRFRVPIDIFWQIYNKKATIDNTGAVRRQYEKTPFYIGAPVRLRTPCKEEEVEVLSPSGRKFLVSSYYATLIRNYAATINEKGEITRKFGNKPCHVAQDPEKVKISFVTKPNIHYYFRHHHHQTRIPKDLSQHGTLVYKMFRFQMGRLSVFQSKLLSKLMLDKHQSI